MSAAPFRYPLVARALFATLGASCVIGITESSVLLVYVAVLGGAGKGAVLLCKRIRQGREGVLF